MVKQTVTVRHEKGLHARPASAFVETAAAYDEPIEVGIVDGSEVADAKSSLAVMSMGVEDGTEIAIRSDSADAVDTLVELVEDDFKLSEEAD